MEFEPVIGLFWAPIWDTRQAHHACRNRDAFNRKGCPGRPIRGSSSNENSLYHVNVTRFAKRPVSLRICSNQNFSLGELPFTTAKVLVLGNTRRMLSKTAGKLFATATTVSFAVRVEY